MNFKVVSVVLLLVLSLARADTDQDDVAESKQAENTEEKTEVREERNAEEVTVPVEVRADEAENKAPAEDTEDGRRTAAETDDKVAVKRSPNDEPESKADDSELRTDDKIEAEPKSDINKEERTDDSAINDDQKADERSGDDSADTNDEHADTRTAEAEAAADISDASDVSGRRMSHAGVIETKGRTDDSAEDNVGRIGLLNAHVRNLETIKDLASRRSYQREIGIPPFLAHGPLTHGNALYKPEIYNSFQKLRPNVLKSTDSKSAESIDHFNALEKSGNAYPYISTALPPAATYRPFNVNVPKFLDTDHLTNLQRPISAEMQYPNFYKRFVDVNFNPYARYRRYSDSQPLRFYRVC